MQEIQSEKDIQVKLKPVFGIRPGVYLTVLYAFILLAILFFLLLFPGLKNPGAVLLVKTEPAGAAIRVNGVYMGTSASRIPIPNGTHTIEAVSPGFESQSAVHTIKGRVFGSLFFPLRYNAEFKLKSGDPVSAFALGAADFAAWTFAGEPTTRWQIPMSLSESAYRIGPYAGELKEELTEILTAASRFTVTRAALRDMIRAKILLDNYGNAPSPTALLDSIVSILGILTEMPGAAAWMGDLMPADVSRTIETSRWFASSYAHRNVYPFTGDTQRQFTLAGLSFIEIPATAGSQSFYISQTPVSASVFEAFLNENGEYRESQIDYFPDELSVNPLDIQRGAAISGVTFYAALSFCKWLTLRLPSSMAGMEVMLPTEAQWLTAARLVENMNIPGWEWCADPYAPHDFINVSQKAMHAVGSPEYSLRGRASATSTETRASLPPELSSPFVTFRVVITDIVR
ncbi:MAG: SUMF1/EgtB/PvdO family nonheme iron enzyme [Treponema sp.]|nr:SUMF1/EgtB/PvdO family nonheme iron enzyme [Treponema sp.]